MIVTVNFPVYRIPVGVDSKGRTDKQPSVRKEADKMLKGVSLLIFVRQHCGCIVLTDMTL